MMSMALTNSNMPPLGTPAPDFSLSDPATGKTVTFAERARDNIALVMFLSNHCPYVQHVLDGLLELTHEYQDQGVAVLAISSNDADKYPDDGPEKMAQLAAEKNFTFPYLFDADQSVAKAYQAACTPDFFVFDRDGELVYRGQMDGSRPDNDVPVTGDDLRAALDAVFTGEEPAAEQVPSSGCNIKWK
jgi:peroxiredoxin